MAITMNGAYLNGLDQGGLRTALAQIPGSATTDYILFSLNVKSGTSADINFGNSGPVLATGGQVTAAARNMLFDVITTGVTRAKCQRAWLSLGGAGSNAFTNIQTILNTGGALKATLLANFAAIVQLLGAIRGVQAVGFDMDYEEGGTDLAALVATVTVALYNEFKCPVTFCPYAAQSAWIQALQQVYSALGTQPVAGFNLQIYAGGAGNDPTAWAKAVAAAPNTGVPNPAAFVWPIFSCDTTAQPVSTPTQVTQAMRGYGSAGASLWATASLPFQGSTLTSYATAIIAGIG
ncbi:MAG: hypothetical protein PW843_25030 [Azospirillaceae bacterium]|nr:hypothetical protein [Azospirillaceae bacterium]